MALDASRTVVGVSLGKVFPAALEQLPKMQSAQTVPLMPIDILICLFPDLLPPFSLGALTVIFWVTCLEREVSLAASCLTPCSLRGFHGCFFL